MVRSLFSLGKRKRPLRFGFRRRKVRKFRHRRGRFTRRFRRMAPELKVSDRAPAPYNPSSGVGISDRVFEIQNGTGIGDRIGDSILLQSVDVRGTITMSATDVALHTVVRIALIQDMQQVADTTVLTGTVWESVTNPLSFRERDSTGRFKMLWTQRYTFTKADEWNRFRTFSIHHKFRGGLKVRYNGTGIADLQKNGVFLLMQSDAGAGTPTTIATLMRATYTDS